jgi:hypothetical protein
MIKKWPLSGGNIFHKEARRIGGFVAKPFYSFTEHYTKGKY